EWIIAHRGPLSLGRAKLSLDRAGIMASDRGPPPARTGLPGPRRSSIPRSILPCRLEDFHRIQAAGAGPREAACILLGAVGRLITRRAAERRASRISEESSGCFRATTRCSGQTRLGELARRPSPSTRRPSKEDY